MSESPAAETTHRNRTLMGLLLLLAVGGAAGAVTIAILRDERPARPAAGGEQSGTGTVVGGTEGTPPAGDTEGVFHIAGRATGLVPGRPATLALRVTNPNPWPIHVLTLDTDVTQPPGADCPVGTLRVGGYDYTSGEVYAAPARGTVEVPVRIELADSTGRDQSGCAGVTFPLTMTGTAVRAR